MSLFPFFVVIDVSQLNKILDVVGFPEPALLSQLNDDARVYLERMPRRPSRVDFYTHFNRIESRTAIDLVEKLLQLDPEQRLTCEQALEHPYLEKFHDPDDEPSGQPFEDDIFESENISVEKWKELILNEIKTFIPREIDFN